MAFTQKVSSGAILEADTANVWNASSSGASTGFKQIQNVIDIDPPIEAEQLDNTVQQSGSNAVTGFTGPPAVWFGAKAFRSGLLNFGLSFTVKADFTADATGPLWTPYQIWRDGFEHVYRAYRFTFSPGQTGSGRMTCNFMVSKISRPRPVGQIMVLQIDLKATTSLHSPQLVLDTAP